MIKPREWWIWNGEINYDGPFMLEPEHIPIEGQDHVIEKSAYDELEAKVKALEANACPQFDAYYKHCEVENGLLSDSVKHSEKEVTRWKETADMYHTEAKNHAKTAVDAFGMVTELNTKVKELEAEVARLKTKCNDYQAQLEDNEWKVEKALQLRIEDLEAANDRLNLEMIRLTDAISLDLQREEKINIVLTEALKKLTDIEIIAKVDGGVFNPKLGCYEHKEMFKAEINIAKDALVLAEEIRGKS